MRKLLLLLLLTGTMVAQTANTVTIQGTVAPTGACAAIMRYVNTATGDTYSCKITAGVGAWLLSAPSTVITGTIASNQVAKGTAAGIIGASSITDNGTVVATTEPVNFPVGSVGAPSITWTGETNTGFWDINGNAMYFSFAGNPRFRWDNNYVAASVSVIGFAGGNPDAVAIDTGLSRDAAGVIDVGTGAAGSTAGTLKAAKLTGTTPTGIYNFNQSAQSQIVVSATEYYITNSDLDMPATYTTAIGAGTTMSWRVAMTKTAAGTGSAQILVKKGTNGSTADTTIATFTIGTQTAVADNMEFDLNLTWTSATAAYLTFIPHQSAATGTGFGLVYPAAAAQFSTTISGQTTTTASDKYGLSFKMTTGTPTIVVNEVRAQAFGVN